MTAIYIYILQLDGFLGVLTPYERAMAHKKNMSHVVIDADTENIKVLGNLVTRYMWCTPQVKYDDSRNLKYYDSEIEGWRDITKYTHPIIIHALSIFKTQ